MNDQVETLIYHNPRCSKSRATLALLEENGIKPTQIEYLTTPPSIEELKNILTLLNLKPQQLIRCGEQIYKDLALAEKELSDNELIQIMVDNPKLIERPIVIINGKARIGRPPESVLEII